MRNPYEDEDDDYNKIDDYDDSHCYPTDKRPWYCRSCGASVTYENSNEINKMCYHNGARSCGDLYNKNRVYYNSYSPDDMDKMRNRYRREV